MKKKRVNFEPDIGAMFRFFLEFARVAKNELNEWRTENFASTLSCLRDSVMEVIPQAPDECSLKTAVAKSVLLDLMSLGWEIDIQKDQLNLRPPVDSKGGVLESKEAVRRSHLVERDAQLREKPVIDFVSGMERRRLTKYGWHSIFSVMRDGRGLAERLNEIAKIRDSTEQMRCSRHVIAPYLQFVNGKEKCNLTGLALRDIWRYFRHTWVNAYKALPGRSMMILVRDAAAKNHPVIGIAGLGSSVAQQRIRDRWIGWDQETFVEALRARPSAKYGKWLLRTLDTQLQSIYRSDLSRDGLCHSIDLDYPTLEVIQVLETEAERCIRQHRLFPRAADTKAQQVTGNLDWESQAKTHLFRSKRCRMLARMLRIRREFQSAGFNSGTKKELAEAIARSNFRNAVGQLIRIVKAGHVGINMMDIIICGAVQPYNALLGGKLISMLLCSPEVVQEYARRYGGTESIIASSMRGAPVVRDPKLVLLCTTSLYGVGSSQYNRLKIPCDAVTGRSTESIQYKCLGKSEGYGSYHFSKVTLKLMDTLLARSKKGRRVHSIFGEGVNPRLRKIREALEELKLPSDYLLMHGRTRVIYGVSLIRDIRNSLIGLSKRSSYLIPQKNPKKRTEEIGDFWRKRWLLKRILNPEVISEVSRHTLSYPVTHGARVPLPQDENQMELEFRRVRPGAEDN